MKPSHIVPVLVDLAVMVHPVAFVGGAVERSCTGVPAVVTVVAPWPPQKRGRVKRVKSSTSRFMLFIINKMRQSWKIVLAGTRFESYNTLWLSPCFERKTKASAEKQTGCRSRMDQIEPWSHDTDSECSVPARIAAVCATSGLRISGRTTRSPGSTRVESGWMARDDMRTVLHLVIYGMLIFALRKKL